MTPTKDLTKETWKGLLWSWIKGINYTVVGKVLVTGVGDRWSCCIIVRKQSECRGQLTFSLLTRLRPQSM